LLQLPVDLLRIGLLLLHLLQQHADLLLQLLVPSQSFGIPTLFPARLHADNGRDALSFCADGEAVSREPGAEAADC
jgi:hypothetical protein